MKIIIDNSNLIVGGGIQVATSFLYDLNKQRSTNQYVVIQSYNSSQDIEKGVFLDNFLFFDLSNKESFSILKRRKRVREIENMIKPDVIFTTFGPSYHKSNYPKIVGFAIPYLIYPESPFFDKLSLKERLKYQLFSYIKKRAFVRNSDCLIFETEDARSIFTDSTSTMIETYTVSNTLNEVFFDMSKWEDFNGIDEKSYNILCLSAFYPHKNLSIIPEVINVLINFYNFHEFKFNISVSEDKILLNEEHKKYVNFIDKVSLSKIPDLYKKSQVVFIPTLLEVFSATYLEAMFMNKPIIASDMSFARDICKDAALYCSPLDAKAYAKAIYDIYSNIELRNNLVTNGTENLKRFGSSMDRTNKYLEIIKSQSS